MMPPQLQPLKAACVSRLIGHDHARPDTHLAPQLDQSAVVKASQRCIVSPPLRRPFCGAQIPIANAASSHVPPARFPPLKVFVRRPHSPRHLTHWAGIRKPSHNRTHAAANDMRGCSALFDHLIGAGKQRRRNFEADRLCGFEVDGKLVLGRRLHWKVGGLLPLEDAIDVAGCSLVLADVIKPKRDQTTTKVACLPALTRSKHDKLTALCCRDISGMGLGGPILEEVGIARSVEPRNDLVRRARIH
jgi:hypothetical protein